MRKKILINVSKYENMLLQHSCLLVSDRVQWPAIFYTLSIISFVYFFNRSAFSRNRYPHVYVYYICIGYFWNIWLSSSLYPSSHVSRGLFLFTRVFFIGFSRLIFTFYPAVWKIYCSWYFIYQFFLYFK